MPLLFRTNNAHHAGSTQIPSHLPRLSPKPTCGGLIQHALPRLYLSQPFQGYERSRSVCGYSGCGGSI